MRKESAVREREHPQSALDVREGAVAGAHPRAGHLVYRRRGHGVVCARACLPEIAGLYGSDRLFARESSPTFMVAIAVEMACAYGVARPRNPAIPPETPEEI